MNNFIFTLMSRLRRRHRFLTDIGGASAVFVAIAIVPLVGFAGLATDTARGYLVKLRLSEALDAAGLAAARELDPAGRDADALMFFRANFPVGFLDSVVDGPHLSESADNQRLTLTATAVIPTTFTRVLGHETLTVAARTVVQRESRGMELTLVMDNTGSMRSGGRMTTMKEAAQDLVNILYGPNETIDGFWVALVPFAATVNIGQANASWLTALDPAAFDPTVWKGCVEARYGTPRDTTDDPPSVERWAPFYWLPNVDNEWEIGDPDTVNELNSAQNNGTGPNLGCGPAITPLTQPKATITAAIAEMQPWHRGGTMTNQGAVWGWRTLSPRWRGLWGGDPALPLDYDAPLSTKVMILLTDGQNQFYDWPEDGAGPNGSDYTAYRRRTENMLGIPNTSSGNSTTELNRRMELVCQAMKAEGITLYTILFQENNAATEASFLRCATSPQYFFKSPTNDDLRQAFRTIASQLSNLRLAE